MPAFRLALASLLFSSVLGACAAAPAPVPVKPIPNHVEGHAQLDRATVRAKLAARRADAIKHFLAYREAGVYPINTIGPGAKHVWVDGAGNLCAAATLISYDWGRDETVKAGIPDVQIQLAKVRSGALMDWILTSGLTHHEIVAIQVPPMAFEPDERTQEMQRLYAMYVDVERQLTTLADKNLELATDALMKDPDLARALIDNRLSELRGARAARARARG